MNGPKPDWYRDWSKSIPSRWEDPILGIASVSILVLLAISALRNV